MRHFYFLKHSPMKKHLKIIFICMLTLGIFAATPLHAQVPPPPPHGNPPPPPPHPKVKWPKIKKPNIKLPPHPKHPQGTPPAPHGAPPPPPKPGH